MGSDEHYIQANAGACPQWVPQPVVQYLTHMVNGKSIRNLARQADCHASTMLRSIRRVEQRREDPLVDSALCVLERFFHPNFDQKETALMTALIRHSDKLPCDDVIDKEARRILRRLCETGAFLAIAPDLEKAVVLKNNADGDATRIAVVSRSVVEAFVLKDWVARDNEGRVVTYRITQAGRSALKRLLESQQLEQQGFAEAQSPFAAQHGDWATREITTADGRVDGKRRYNLSESPLAVLARRKDKNGEPFLTPDLVTAGERLREDFELAQMGPRVTQNWDRFMTGGDRGVSQGGSGIDGPKSARDRVALALRDLGPGLGDVVLRCCCFLEGMEVAEKRMGWSARSGKIVLRIALQRLRRHYDDAYGPGGGMIG